MAEQEDFKISLPHIENVRISLDKILNSKLKIKNKRKVEFSSTKVVFMKLIDEMVKIGSREADLVEMFEINLINYNDAFYSIIDNFITYTFNEKQASLIKFYIYDKTNANGTMNVLYDSETDGDIVLNNSEDLYNMIESLK